MRHSLASPLVQGSLEELLLTSMLLELPSNAAEELYWPQTSRYSGEAQARRSVDWATDHVTEPITMTSWAAGVGLSVRHLQKVFREVHGCTPGQYLLGLRLERAHKLLQRATPNRTVTAIATETGFGHVGRFASAYRERFGAHPSATLRRAG